METPSSVAGPDSKVSSTWWVRGLTLRERQAAGEQGSAETIAGRYPRPAWVDLIERAIAAGPATVALDDEVLIGDGINALAPALLPLATQAAAQLTGNSAGADIDLTAVRAGLRDWLGCQLNRLAARTLVLELNVARTNGELAGATPQSRFADYLRQARTGPRMAALFTRYPVLARIVGMGCEQAIRAYQEILARFAADRATIVAQLLGGTDPGRLIAVEAGNGDLHRGGRSVAVLRFADGRSVIYKPRSLAMHRRFEEFIGWLNADLPWLRLRTIGSIVRDGYGWQEYVAQQPCDDPAGIDRFYVRQGALLALLHALDGTDIHHENVVACGDQPVVVDVETLFHPILQASTVIGPDPALRALMASVYRTALLPLMMVGEHGALDMSGVGGDRNGTYPVNVVSWDGAGTDRMRLVRRPGQFGGHVNRPRLGDQDADPADHATALLTGFRAAYDAIVRGRRELLDEGGLLARCAEDEIRIVARSTRTYAMLLDESTHPDVLRDGLDRERLFDALTASSPTETLLRLVPHEIRDMWTGDVPIFLGRPGSRHCWTAHGQALPDLLDSTGLASVAAKLARMGEVDRHDQEWVIRATLASRTSPTGHRSGEALPGPVAAAVPDPERLLSSACAVADEIVARTLHDDDRANWLSMEQVDGRQWMVVPMGAGLGTGYSGVALFLAQLGAVTGIGRYADLARKAVRPIPRLIDALSERVERAEAIGCGGFLGLGGICYAVARIGTLLGDADLLDLSARIVPLVDLADDGTETSLATGRAGGLAAMLAVYAETGLAAAGTLAAEFARRLIEPAHPDPEKVATPGDSWPTNGFLWGPTGVGWALSRFAAAGGGHLYAEPGRRALELDSSHLNDGGPDDGGPDYGWCAGMSGASLARASARADDGGGSTARSLSPHPDHHLSLLADRPPLRDMSLCHGELGILESLTVLGAHGNAGAAATAERRAAFLLGALDQFGPRCGTPTGVSCPGLLAGLAGIGYGLLRLGLTGQIPSVLLLEPSAARAIPTTNQTLS